MSTLNIAGLDRVEVLRALYNAARPQGMGRLMYVPGDMSREDAEELLAEADKFGSYFDYLQGRVMKLKLKGDAISVALYERDNGLGSARAALKAHGLEPSAEPPPVDKGGGVVTVTEGMSGWFAVHMVDGEPEESGAGRYETREEAEAEAREWANGLGLRFIA